MSSGALDGPTAANYSKRAYFDSIADQWDSREDTNGSAERLASGLDEIGLEPDETVVDVGCGTGNLTGMLLARLSSGGRVVAVDISPRMIEVAKCKISDRRVEWMAVDVARLPLPDSSADRIICYSVWPHFDRPKAAAMELLRVLKQGATLHVWHTSSRRKINEIHAAAGEAVRGDMLPQGNILAGLLNDCGFSVIEVIDEPSRYLINALKPGM